MTRTELLARLQPGDALTFMGVLSGTGIIYSVDHNDNAVYDGDEPPPAPSLTTGPGGLSLSGPPDSGWVPEWTAELPPSWQTLTDQPQRDAIHSLYPAETGGTRRFFRFRRTW